MIYYPRLSCIDKCTCTQARQAKFGKLAIHAIHIAYRYPAAKN